MQGRATRLDIALAASLAAATAVLGALRVGDTALWFDEAFSARVASLDVGGLARTLADEAGMAPFYVALWVWRHGGDGDVWLRWLAVLGGAAAVAALYGLGRRLFDRPIAVAASVVLLCHPFTFRYLTELRAYSWVLCFAVLSTWAYVALVEHPTPARGVLYGVSSGVLVALLAFAAGLVPAHLIGDLRPLRTRAGRRTLALAAAVTALCLLPTLPAMLRSNQVDWIRPTSWRSLQSTGSQVIGRGLLAAVLLGGLALLAGHAWRSGPDTKRKARLVVSCAVVPVVGLVAVSLLRPLLVPRYAGVAVPFVALGATAGWLLTARSVLAGSPLRAHPAALTWGSAGLLALAAVALGPQPPWVDAPRLEDPRELAAALDRLVRPNDAVVFVDDWYRAGLARYWDDPKGNDVAFVRWTDDRVPPDLVDEATLATELARRPCRYLIGWQLGDDAAEGNLAVYGIEPADDLRIVAQSGLARVAATPACPPSPA